MSTSEQDLPFVAKNIRKAMKFRDVSYAMLAGLTKLNPTSVMRILTGATENPRRSTVERIARALDVPTDDLLNPYGLDTTKLAPRPSAPGIPIPEPVQESLFAPPAKPKAPEGTVPLVPGMLYVDGYVKDLFIPTRAVPIPTVLASLPPERRENLFAVRSDRSYDCGIRQGDLLFILRGETAPGALLLVQGNDYTAEVIRSDALRRIDHECCGLIAALERSLL